MSSRVISHVILDATRLISYTIYGLAPGGLGLCLVFSNFVKPCNYWLIHLEDGRRHGTSVRTAFGYRLAPMPMVATIRPTTRLSGFPWGGVGSSSRCRCPSLHKISRTN